MSLVATLICNPANPALDCTIVDGARAVLPSPGAAQWLFDEVAVDIPFAGSDDVKAIETRLRQARGDLPIDIVGAACSAPAQEAFLADMDSTMIGQECIDELADFAGLKAHVAGHYRTRDARRNRVRAGAARARRAVEGHAGQRGRRGAETAHHANAGRPRTGHDHARQWRLHLPDLGRLYAVHQCGGCA